MHNQFNMTTNSSDVIKIGESVFGEPTTELPKIEVAHRSSEKKTFKRLIKRASLPVTKEHDKQQRPLSSGRKQTRPHKTGDVSG